MPKRAPHSDLPQTQNVLTLPSAVIQNLIFHPKQCSNMMIAKNYCQNIICDTLKSNTISLFRSVQKFLKTNFHGILLSISLCSFTKLRLHNILLYDRPCQANVKYSLNRSFHTIMATFIKSVWMFYERHHIEFIALTFCLWRFPCHHTFRFVYSFAQHSYKVLPPERKHLKFLIRQVLVNKNRCVSATLDWFACGYILYTVVILVCLCVARCEQQRIEILF